VAVVQYTFTHKQYTEQHNYLLQWWTPYAATYNLHSWRWT